METSELFSPHYGRIFTSFVPLACNHHFAEGALQYYYIIPNTCSIVPSPYKGLFKAIMLQS